jgi:hypothetical protein
MRDALDCVFSVISLVIGVAILREDVVHSGAGQTLQVILGATFLSLGLIIGCLVLTKWLDWRKYNKKFRDG